MKFFLLLVKLIFPMTQAPSEEEHFQISVWKIKHEYYRS